METLAAKIDLNPRTLKRWLAGEKAYVTSIRALAAVLGAKENIAELVEGEYPELAQAPEKVEAAQVTVSRAATEQADNDTVMINIRIALTIPKGDPNQSPVLLAIADFLRSVVPDNNNIRVVGVVGTTGIIAVMMSPDNVLAMGSEVTSTGLGAFGATSANVVPVSVPVSLMPTLKKVCSYYNPPSEAAPLHKLKKVPQDILDDPRSTEEVAREWNRMLTEASDRFESTMSRRIAFGHLLYEYERRDRLAGAEPRLKLPEDPS